MPETAADFARSIRTLVFCYVAKPLPPDPECQEAADATDTAVRLLLAAGVTERSLAFGLIETGSRLLCQVYGPEFARGHLTKVAERTRG